MKKFLSIHCEDFGGLCYQDVSLFMRPEARKTQILPVFSSSLVPEEGEAQGVESSGFVIIDVEAYDLEALCSRPRFRR